MKRPTISTVISVLNGAETLQRCLDSVARQTFSDRELVVIDGGSIDATPEILRRNASRLAYWVSEPDRGIYHAWNKGLAQASGEWIHFLGADDCLPAQDVFERLAPVLSQAYPAARIVYGRVIIESEEGTALQELGEAWTSAKGKFRQIMPLPHTGVLHHRSLFERHGGFDPSFSIAGDYEMLLRELPANDAVFVPELVLAIKRRGGVSTEPGSSLRMMREVRRAQIMHGIRWPGRLWLVAYLKSWTRTWMWRILGQRLAPHAFDILRQLTGQPRYWTRR